ncbi:unnamed protein product [Gongylonema pulchrum]|uniref:TPX2_importin domain-containing protein n=1 Tax=Gongylonema pulchrum TaxID=637853 RepID=A0A183CXJ7_9BILA|nr:unnamed protein product [Gongylonema pulchrum]
MTKNYDQNGASEKMKQLSTAASIVYPVFKKPEEPGHFPLQPYSQRRGSSLALPSTGSRIPRLKSTETIGGVSTARLASAETLARHGVRITSFPHNTGRSEKKLTEASLAHLSHIPRLQRPARRKKSSPRATSADKRVPRTSKEDSTGLPESEETLKASRQKPVLHASKASWHRASPESSAARVASADSLRAHGRSTPPSRISTGLAEKRAQQRSLAEERRQILLDKPTKETPSDRSGNSSKCCSLVIAPKSSSVVQHPSKEYQKTSHKPESALSVAGAKFKPGPSTWIRSSARRSSTKSQVIIYSS